MNLPVASFTPKFRVCDVLLFPSSLQKYFMFPDLICSRNHSSALDV